MQEVPVETRELFEVFREEKERHLMHALITIRKGAHTGANGDNKKCSEEKEEVEVNTAQTPEENLEKEKDQTLLTATQIHNDNEKGSKEE